MNYEQLKNSILQEAIEGRLVPQDPNDEPASVLLDKIREEKARLVKEGKIKKDKIESRIYRTEDGHWMEHFEDKKKADVCIDDDIPFDIPESWSWERWGNISQNIQYGYNAPALPNGDIKMVRISDIQDNQVQWESVPYCNIRPEDVDTYLLGDNDILFARTGGTVGKSFLVKNVPEPAIYAGYLIRTRYSQSLVPEYLKFFMESSLYWSQLRNGTIATAQPNCNGKTLGQMFIPLPPLSEQQRIVSKIEEILPKIEEYGKAQSKLDALNAALPQKLKNSILQEAIEGRLVPQDPNDEPASVLLDKIREEKARLVKEGKIKKDKNESRIYRTDDGHWMEHYEDKKKGDVCIDDEIPFDIPESWEWCRLGNLISVSSGKSIDKSSIRENAQYPVYGGNGIIGYCDSYNVDKNTIIIGRVGAKCGNVHITTMKSWITDNALITSFIKGLFELKWFKYIITFLDLRQCANQTAQPVISGKTIYPLFIPLPPLFEQQRIVAKIEQLMKEIDKM